MSKNSTLVFLVNKIKSEVTSQSFIGSSEYDNFLVEDKKQSSPPDCVVNSLLNYARSLKVTESEAVGDMEWVLN